MFIKVLCRGVRIKFLYSELWGLFVFSEGHLFIGAAHFVSFLGLHPASCGSDHISGPQFNLPNVIMDQANQPPGRLWGLAKHYQLWHT